MIDATLYTDPACPWAYSATPALTVLEWRYRHQIRWRLVAIGLRDVASAPAGYTPVRSAIAARRFRDRYGMPFAPVARPRALATGRACRAIVAARLHHPGQERAVLLALQRAWFTTTALLDDDAAIAAVLREVPGVDAVALTGALDAPEVEEAYTADRAQARSAAGGPTDFQGKAATAENGATRYTAPSVIFEESDRRLEAGGFQPIEAYDVLIANLDTSIERFGAPEEPLALLEYFDRGLCTAEVAALLAGNLEDHDRAGAEDALIDLVAAGRARRVAIGDDALWYADSPREHH